MNLHSKIWFMVLAPLTWLLLMATPQAANLALNPGMEDWQSTTCLHWTPADGATYLQSAVAHQGAYALQVVPSAAYTGVNQTGVAVQVGHTYQVTCWIRGANAGSTQPLRLMIYGGGSYPQTTTGNLSDTTYQQYSFTFTADGPSLIFNVVPWDAPATDFAFLIDDVDIEELPGGLASNGDVENWNGTDCVDWTSIDGGTLSQSTDAHSGSYALKVTPSGNYSGTNHGWINVEPGASYALSCWMKGAQAGDKPGMRLMVYTTEVSPNVFISKAVSYLSDSTYQQYVLRFTVPTGVTRLVLNIVSFVSTEGSFLIDDVKLRKTNSLILNGDMEDWTLGTPDGAEFWQQTSFASSVAVTTTALESSHSLAVTPTELYGGIRQEDLPAQGNTDYRLIAWLAAAGDQPSHPVRLLIIEPGVGWQGAETVYESMSTDDQGGLSSHRWRKFVFDFKTFAAQTVDDVEPTLMHLEIGSYAEAPTGVTFLVDKVWLGRRGIDAEPVDPGAVSIGPQEPSAAKSWTLY
jgi:hypothetical protein